jgi:translation initiation factor 1
MSDEKTPFHNPFGALSNLRDKLPQAPARVAPAPPPEPAVPAHVKLIPRAVVRMERSGRGGKEVTVVEHLDISPAERERWLTALKAALGCGGKVEVDAIMLQGDQRSRLPKILTARGVKKITVA